MARLLYTDDLVADAVQREAEALRRGGSNDPAKVAEIAGHLAAIADDLRRPLNDDPAPTTWLGPAGTFTERAG